MFQSRRGSQRLTMPGPIHIQFGYRVDQLVGIYVPLAVLALALTLIAMSLSRAGLADLNRSVFLLGTMFWLAAAAWLQAAGPLRILLFGSPLANIPAALLQYCPPLLCVAVGTALGHKMSPERTRGDVFGEFFWSFGMLLFPLMSAMTAVPSMTNGVDRGSSLAGIRAAQRRDSPVAA